MRTLAVLLLVAFPAFARVIAVDVHGMIHPVTVEIVSHAIEQAERENAGAVLIRLDTPGGLLDATRQINSRILAAKVPVIVYVTPSGARAASAGFLILEAAKYAVMAPGTNTGAASPVLVGQEMDPVMRSKVENDTAAGLRSIAAIRGRNGALAEKAIREAKAFSSQEALDQNLIDLVAPNEPDLLRSLKIPDPSITVYRPTAREQVVSAIADPNIGFVLLILGGLGIYLEFTHPGLILPGVAGGILALLGLSALSVLPINWAGAGLLVLAVALFVLEAKFASHGILGIGGAVAMVLGAMLLIDAPPEFRIRLSTALSVSLPFAAITVVLLRLVISARRAKVITGGEGMRSEIGEARTEIAPRGKVFVHGEYWDAESATHIAPGAKIRVVGIDGMTLKVEPLS